MNDIGKFDCTIEQSYCIALWGSGEMRSEQFNLIDSRHGRSKGVRR